MKRVLAPLAVLLMVGSAALIAGCHEHSYVAATPYDDSYSPYYDDTPYDAYYGG
jgi:hypothetical protein